MDFWFLYSNPTNNHKVISAPHLQNVVAPAFELGILSELHFVRCFDGLHRGCGSETADYVDEVMERYHYYKKASS